MRYQRGFSLIELMVTITIFAILAGIVAPSFLGFISDNRLSSQINTLVGSVRYARSEAVNRQRIVTLCASSDMASCDTTSWENGWILFTDSNNGGNAVIDGDDTLLMAQEGLEGNTTLRTSGFSFASAGIVQLGALGYLYGSSPTAGTFVLCDDRGAAQARAIVINVAGTSRVATDEDGDGVRNLHSGAGSNVTCP